MCKNYANEIAKKVADLEATKEVLELLQRMISGAIKDAEDYEERASSYKTDDCSYTAFMEMAEKEIAKVEALKRIADKLMR